jgi:hypothetical protein
LGCEESVDIDSGCSTNILYWKAFVGMQLTVEQLHAYQSTVVGFFGEQV